MATKENLELDRIESTKTDIYNKIIEKGGTAPTGTLETYPAAIESIPSGGGGNPYTGHADVAGLQSIGWDEQDIAYLQENVWWNEDEDDLYLVNEQDVLLYNNLLTYSTPPTASQINSECKATMARFFPKIDTSHLTSMASMFASSFIVTIPMLNTNNVTNMSRMFSSNRTIHLLPLLNTVAVVDMSYMFSFASSLRYIPKFNTINVTNMSYMFQHSGLLECPLFDTNKVTNIGYMFASTPIVKIPAFNTTSVTVATHIFDGCFYLTSVDNLDLSNVIFKIRLFYQNYSLHYVGNIGITMSDEFQSVFSSTYNLISIAEPLNAKGNCTNKYYLLATNNQLLKDVKFYGIDSTTTLNLSGFNNLSRESLLYLFENAQPVTTSKVLPIGAVNLAKLTDAEKQIIIDKGWVLA